MDLFQFSDAESQGLGEFSASLLLLFYRLSRLRLCNKILCQLPSIFPTARMSRSLLPPVIAGTWGWYRLLVESNYTWRRGRFRLEEEARWEEETVISSFSVRSFAWQTLHPYLHQAKVQAQCRRSMVQWITTHEHDSVHGSGEHMGTLMQNPAWWLVDKLQRASSGLMGACFTQLPAQWPQLWVWN
jgi:hypothetical protein